MKNPTRFLNLAFDVDGKSDVGGCGYPIRSSRRVPEAVVAIGHDGKLRVERDLLRPGEGGTVSADNRAAEADEDENGRPALHAAALIRRLTAHRTAALQITLARCRTRLWAGNGRRVSVGGDRTGRASERWPWAARRRGTAEYWHKLPNFAG